MDRKSKIDIFRGQCIGFGMGILFTRFVPIHLIFTADNIFSLLVLLVWAFVPVVSMFIGVFAFRKYVNDKQD